MEKLKKKTVFFPSLQNTTHRPSSGTPTQNYAAAKVASLYHRVLRSISWVFSAKCGTGLLLVQDHRTCSQRPKQHSRGSIRGWYTCHGTVPLGGLHPACLDRGARRTTEQSETSLRLIDDLFMG